VTHAAAGGARNTRDVREVGRARHRLDVTAAALPGAHTFQSDVSDLAAIALLKERVH
jgi:hypothetical protein